MFRNILVATDGSIAAERAARLAVDLARLQRARLTAVYVVDPYPYLGTTGAHPASVYAYVSAARERAFQAHARIMSLCAGAQPQVLLRLRLIEHARAAPGILRTAQDEGCDLVVAGAHGRSGHEDIILGSVVAKLVQQSPIPVLVAP